VWDEMFGPARTRTIRRMAVEYQQTVNRFGREAG
jgi:hypothetical protein